MQGNTFYDEMKAALLENRHNGRNIRYSIDEQIAQIEKRLDNETLTSFQILTFQADLKRLRGMQ
jgi:hypothetical protein